MKNSVNILLITVIASLFTITPLSGQYWGNEKFTPVSHNLVNGLLYNLSHSVILNDNLYYTDCYGLHIYDISDPSTPVKVGEAPIPGQCIHFAIKNSYAYVLNELGFVVVDISDVTSPEAIKMVSIGVEPLQIACSGNTAFIAYGEGLMSYSITNPSLPTFLDNLYIPPATTVFAGLAVSGDMVYYANQRYLYTVDASDPDDLSVVNTQEFVESGSCWGNLQVHEGSLFVVTTLALNVFDISTPSAPELIYGDLPTSFTIYDLAIDGDFMITNHNSNGKWSILDISDPAQPEVIYTQTINEFFGLYSIGTLDDNILVILDNGQIGYDGYTVHLIDISDNTDPEEISAIESLPGKSRSLTLLDKDAYQYTLIAQDNSPSASTPHGFLRILETNDPENPQLISTLELPKGCVSIAAGGDYVFVSAYGYDFPLFPQSLYLINIQDVENPYIMDEIPIGDLSTGFYETGNLSYYDGILYMASKNEIRMYKIISGTLNEIGNGSIYGEHGFGIFVSNPDYLYLAGGSYGFQIYSTVSPGNPVLASFYDTPGICWDVYVTDNKAFCADYTEGLCICDVTLNIAVPVTQFQTVGPAISVYVVDDIAYVGLEDGRIEIVDVSDPYNPVSEGWYLTNGGRVNDIYMDPKDYYFYIANELEMMVFRSDFNTGTEDNGDKITMTEIHPNPCGDAAHLRFELSYPGQVMINLYHASGLLLKHFDLGNLSFGHHWWSTDVSDLSAGLYFLEINTGSHNEAIKFIKR